MRCMLSKMMMYGANVLVIDQPTNHLDLESITAVNNGLIEFKGVLLFASHDHQFVDTIANRIIEIEKEGILSTFSPPESTSTGFNTSSPEKSIRPKNPRR